MSDVVALSLAQREVQVVVDDTALRAAIISKTQGFLIEPSENPWCRVELKTCPREDTVQRMHVVGRGPRAYTFTSSLSRGEIRLGQPHTLQGEVADEMALFQLLHLCLALALPGEKGLLLHADTVEWNGKAIAFLGHSGIGKSTAASQIIQTTNAVRISIDRTVVLLKPSGTPVVASLPQMMREEHIDWCRREVPLTGLIFPKRGSEVLVKPMDRLQSLLGILQSIILPQGDGLPVAQSLDHATLLSEKTWAGELIYWRGQDFSSELRTRRLEI